MSKLTLTIRFSDNTLCAFKVQKKLEFTYFKNILLLNQESNMISFLKEHGYPMIISAKNTREHNDYENSKAFFAPYDYGIVFIDFAERKVYSYNNYSAFLEYSTLAFKHEIESLIPIDHHSIKYDKNTDNKVISDIQETIEHVLNINSSLSNIGFNLHQALKHNGQIFYVPNNKTKPPVLIDTENSVLAFYKILSMIKPVDYSQPLRITPSDTIRLIPEGWTIISSDKEHINELFNTISTIIPKEQHTLWESDNN